MKLPRFLTLAALGLCVLPGANGWSQEPMPPGLKVGQAAPKFELVDQSGKAVSLQSLLQKKKLTAVIFYRSASW